MRPLPALGLALLLSGCLAAPASLPAPAHVPDLAALIQGVPCEVPSVGADSTPNLKLVDSLPLQASSGRLGAIDLHGDLAIVGRYDEGGFVVLNVSDVAKPRLVSTFTDTPGPALDTKFTKEGDTVLLPTLDGIDLVDVRDPAHPTKESKWTFPPDPVAQAMGQNAHRLMVFQLGDKELVLLAPNANTGEWILQLKGAPGARTLALLGKAGEGLNGYLGPHDAWAENDPDLGKPILYIANGFHGWLAYDISDPAHAQLLGGSPNADPYQGYTHTIRAVHLGGKRLVITIAEVGSEAVKVYDATDLRLPTPLAFWSARAAALAPEHFFQVVGDKMVLAHYADGLFAFNLSALPPAPIPGLWGPMARYVAGPDPGPYYGFVGTYDVAVNHGLLYVVQRERGLDVLAFGCFPPGDAALTASG